MISPSKRTIVLATAKIHILKQFTTATRYQQRRFRLCLLLQRYTFWSNSQLANRIYLSALYCACYCKDTHFEAIHNPFLQFRIVWNIVLATAKIHILKQFTTKRAVKQVIKHCACYCKDTHFEAIHNCRCRYYPHRKIVLATAKIHILKQFTTEVVILIYTIYCACYCKDTHFEAIHNARTDAPHKNLIVLATAKIHILKQFTTTCFEAICWF